MIQLILSLLLSAGVYHSQTPAHEKKITNPKLKQILLEAPPAFDYDPTSRGTFRILWFDKSGRINWDAEKQQRHIVTDTIVIHHTALEPGLMPDALSELEKTRLYTPRFNSDDPDPYVKGTPIDSSHDRIINGVKQPVFYPYHAMIRADGTIVPLLHEGEVGWQCGNWETNMRSMAIVFDGNFAESTPSEKALNAAAKQIAEWVSKYPIRYLCGHRQVVPTQCPGSWFTTAAQRDLLWRAQKFMK